MSTLRVNNMTNVGGTGSTYATGHTVQTVSNTSSTAVSSTTGSWVSTGLTATITPKFSTSKIVIIATFPTVNTPTNIAGIYTMFRGDVSTGTNLGTTTSSNPGTGQLYSVTGEIRMAYTIHLMDSPSTTSAVTYTAAFNAVNGSTSVMAEGRRGTITLMEVAA